jgi:hypothetical protein
MVTSDRIPVRPTMLSTLVSTSSNRSPWRRRWWRGRERKGASMNWNATQDPEVVVCDGCRTVPLSVLSLDLPEPIAGWKETLEARGIELLEDDLDRPAIRREDARRLVEERREWERQSAEFHRRRQEELARKAAVPASGVPAIEGMDAHESMMAAPDYTTVRQEFGREPPNFLEEELARGQREAAAKQAALRRAKRGAEK